MNIRNFFLSHKIESDLPETTEVIEPIIVREDFTISDADEMPIRAILHTLRERTINFVLDNGLAWGCTDFEVRGVPVRVKLTANYDIQYFVDGFSTFDLKVAIEEIHGQIAF